MALLIAIILWLLGGMLVVVCLALITPIFVRVHLSTSPQLAYRVEVRALAGLAPRLTVSDGPRKGPASGPRPTKKPAGPKQRQKPRRKGVQLCVVRAIPALIKGVLERIHLAELHVDADFGLGDPADTGRLCGLLMPLQYASPMPASVALDLRPDFTGPCLKGSLTAVFRVTVAALVVPFSQFAWRVYGPRR